jgi:hypothetical protein
MTAPWGPALDAEVAYRREQVRAGVGRRKRGWFRRTAPVTGPSPAIAAPGPAIPLRRERADASAPAASGGASRRVQPQPQPTRRAA